MNSVFLVSINAMETIVVIVFYELHILCFVFYLLAAQDQKLGGGGGQLDLGRPLFPFLKFFVFLIQLNFM